MLQEHCNADGLLAQLHRAGGAERQDIQNVAIRKTALRALLVADDGLAAILETAMHDAGCEATQLDRTAVASAHDMGEAGAMKQGVSREQGAEMAGAGPAVDAVVREAVAGVILRGLFAAVSVAIELARKGADCFSDQAHGLKNGGNAKCGVSAYLNTGRSRQRAE